LIHLAGPNQDQLNKNNNLLKQKIRLTSNICDLCLSNNIKLIYMSSLQVYKDYGKNNLNLNSKKNFKNLYSRQHIESEKIILSKFLKNKKMFTILRMGNVFGFKKFDKRLNLNDNLIHNLCNSAIQKKEIFLKNTSIQRTLIPSQLFIHIINLIIKKNFFNNNIENIFYKNFTLKAISKIIQKRLKFLFKINIKIKAKKPLDKKRLKNSLNSNFKFNFDNKKFLFEIDRILKYIKKIN
jgi:nucleoside-diphosphate-sugar epimerase